MTWQSVGTHTFVPTDTAVQVGSFDLAAGQDTIWVKITQLNPVDDWPWSYGILSWRNANGTPLGSLKAYSNRLGEVFRLGNGLPPSDGTGSIWFEPRGFNLGWLKAGFPWELKFEAQAGASEVTSGYWNRDPTHGILSPRSAGDGVDLGTGSLDAAALTADTELWVGTGIRFTAAGSFFVVGEGGESRVLNYPVGTYYRLSDGDFNNPGAVPFSIERSTGGDTRVAFYGDGHAFFAGPITASNVTFRSTDPGLYRNGTYLGPELDLLEEIKRLEGLVQHLYETLRLSPPAGWPVWDGSDDLVERLGKKPKKG